MERDERAASAEALVSLRGMRKAFGQNMVLRSVDLDLAPGQVLALIGGNGAGKSTLMKIIMGIYTHDAGEMWIAGEPIAQHKPAQALARGVYLVPQEPMLFPNMTVEENITMGFQHQKRSELRARLRALLEQMGWRMDVARKADSLSIAEQQLVEILRGLMRNARVLILDEPTSALTFSEVQSLFRTIVDLKQRGIGIIYITHRLNEVFEIATHVAIMRDGAITLYDEVHGVTHDMLVKGLLPPDSKGGETAPARPAQQAPVRQEPLLQAEHLSGYGFEDVSFCVYPGEVLGLAGVVGAGRTELATTLIGRDRARSGRVLLDGKDITGLSTRAVMDRGLGYVAEDRFLHGIFRIADVAANTSAGALPCLGRVFLDAKAEREMAAEYVDSFHTKVVSLRQMLGALSGGNQQKVIIARALSTAQRLLILDEPTRGIDAGARRDVYAIIRRLKAEGLAILLISSDMEEIVELSDRAITMFCGRLNRTFARGEIDQDRLMAAAFGVPKEGERGA
ncbi:MAG: sugar ABC transporter ATP-binding protein [Oscillospiraceae bacterium]|nr:sugar ABC transporter ATP-binding protein [Oscillospiraceae bacterium]